MTKIKIRWSDLGSPTQPGTYRFGLDMVRVTMGEIELAKGNPDAIFTAIHPDFYPDDTPYLLTHVEFPGQVIGSRMAHAERALCQPRMSQRMLIEPIAPGNGTSVGSTV